MTATPDSTTIEKSPSHLALRGAVATSLTGYAVLQNSIAMTIALLLLATFGHAVFWAAVVNRLHGTAYRQSIRHGLSNLFLVLAIVLPLAVGIVLIRQSWLEPAGRPGLAVMAAWSYVVGCALVFFVAAIDWCFRQWHAERRGALLSNHTTRIDAQADSDFPLAAVGVPAFLCRLPGNQALEIHIHEKELAIPRLSRQHDGLRIAHISDLHMSGRIAKGYFERVVEEVNRSGPDLIAVTGDIVEYAKFLGWIPDTLGRLRAPAGIFYVLGNHDRRVSFTQLTGALADAGLIHVGGRWEAIRVRGAPLLVAGNELPWYGPAADTSDAPVQDANGLPLRVLLAHSPDQFGWAQKQDFDLMLAGHNHGGQICLPIVGPILAPSLHGVRYASGVFRRGDTVLHVSRGTSALTPVRFNCPPEVAILTLRPAT